MQQQQRRRRQQKNTPAAETDVFSLCFSEVSSQLGIHGPRGPLRQRCRGGRSAALLPAAPAARGAAGLQEDVERHGAQLLG